MKIAQLRWLKPVGILIAVISLSVLSVTITRCLPKSTPTATTTPTAGIERIRVPNPGPDLYMHTFDNEVWCVWTSNGGIWCKEPKP